MLVSTNLKSHSENTDKHHTSRSPSNLYHLLDPGLQPSSPHRDANLDFQYTCTALSAPTDDDNDNNNNLVRCESSDAWPMGAAEFMVFPRSCMLSSYHVVRKAVQCSASEGHDECD